MAQIDLDGNLPSYVLIHLFKDALSKFGKGNISVKSMDYNVKEGLTVIDEKDVVWKVDVNAIVKIPDNLKDYSNGRTLDVSAKHFCVECDFGIKDESVVCSVCEYLKKI